MNGKRRDKFIVGYNSIKKEGIFMSSKIDVSIVMPCLNESQTLPACIDMAKKAIEKLSKHNLVCEIVISDNGSTDGSQDLARSLGCRVVDCPEKGYGNALIYGLSSAEGKYLVMGDSDASYDFEESVPMVEKLMAGYDVCMGTRLKGTIKDGAMPWKNRYIGNPILTGILNLFYDSKLSDAHCGLRSLTKDAFDRLNLISSGMEFASEMVVKSALLDLKRTEVPITLHPDGRDREPHLRPWRDGWRHLKFLFLFSPKWLYFIPSFIFMLLGFLLFFVLWGVDENKMVDFLGMKLGLHWLPLASASIISGTILFIFGTVSMIYKIKIGLHDKTKIKSIVMNFIKLENMLIFGVLSIITSILIFMSVIFQWGANDFKNLSEMSSVIISTTLFVFGVTVSFGGFFIAIIKDDFILLDRHKKLRKVDK